MTKHVTPPDHDTPPAADPKAGRNPGYAENTPRDATDARTSHAGTLHNRESGGLDRPGGADPASVDTLAE